MHSPNKPPFTQTIRPHSLQRIILRNQRTKRKSEQDNIRNRHIQSVNKTRKFSSTTDSRSSQQGQSQMYTLLEVQPEGLCLVSSPTCSENVRKTNFKSITELPNGTFKKQECLAG